MTILITGGAGFIGSHLTKFLVERGDNIIIVDNFNSYYNPKLKELRIKEFLRDLNFKLYRVDICDFFELKKIFSENHRQGGTSKIDKICHLAAQAGVRYSLENPFIYEKTNILGTLNLLELAKEFKIKDFIYASSSSVYGGNKKIPFSEDDKVIKPLSLYGATKRADELICYTYHQLYKINCVGLRYFTVYGPWGRPDMALFKFTKAILDGEPIEIYNFGKMKRDFTYIDDIIAGTVLAIDKCEGYEIFNLGCSQPVDLEHFIKVIEKITDRIAKKNYLPLQTGDIVETYADITKAQKILGFKPKTKIEVGVKNFIDWYLKYKDLF